MLSERILLAAVTKTVKTITNISDVVVYLNLYWSSPPVTYVDCFVLIPKPNFQSPLTRLTSVSKETFEKELSKLLKIPLEMESLYWIRLAETHASEYTSSSSQVSSVSILLSKKKVMSLLFANLYFHPLLHLKCCFVLYLSHRMCTFYSILIKFYMLIIRILMQNLT